MTAMKVGPVCFLKVTFCNRVLLVYTLWEPLHFLEQGYDFQTWALSPKIRFEELGQYFPPRVGRLLVSGDKVRFLFLLFVTPCELILTARSVLCCSYLPGGNLSFCGSHFLPDYGRQNPWSRIRVLLFFMMFFNAGIWSASTFSFVLFIYLYIVLLGLLSATPIRFLIMMLKKSNPDLEVGTRIIRVCI